MTNYLERNGFVLLYGTLTSPTTIQVIKNNDVKEFCLDFSLLLKKNFTSETAYYDVVVTGLRRGNVILVNEIFDSPEETGIPIVRLGGKFPIKWIFVQNLPSEDIANLYCTKKTLCLLKMPNGLEVFGLDTIPSMVEKFPNENKISMIQTTTEHYDRRFPNLFVCTEPYPRAAGCCDYKYPTLNFQSFQIA